MGLLERHGEIRARVVPSVRKGTLQKEVRASVAPGSTVYTDASYSYRGLHTDYVHEVIDHAESYVRDRVHTNGLENFWSLFKRMIYGTHHSVDPEHLDRYLDEATYRFNSREVSDTTRFVAATARVIGKRITYRQLIGKEALGQYYSEAESAPSCQVRGVRETRSGGSESRTRCAPERGEAHEARTH